MNAFHFISIGLAILSFGVILAIGLKTNILHSATPSPDGDRPYSFSRFQLWLWTLVICPTFALYWGFTLGNTPYINTTSLILLSIPAGVTVTAAVIANSHETIAKQNSLTKSGEKVALLKHQKYTTSFWTDLITDDGGQLSVGRLQQLIFTFIFIVIYLTTFFGNNMTSYPEFANETFMLMGISSGTYLIGKGLKK